MIELQFTVYLKQQKKDTYVSLDLRTVGGARSCKRVPTMQGRFQEPVLKVDSLRWCFGSVQLK